MEIEIIRSSRKTMSLEVTGDGRVLVRAPMRMPRAAIEQFVQEKDAWIREHLNKVNAQRAERARQPGLSMEDIRKLAEEALAVLPGKAARYARQMGVTYGRITIRNQKSRWGSCSAKGNLNFNCLLMLAPEEVQDYVVVHELCHRKEMNHSDRFWREVEQVLPDYRQQRAWLKERGGDIMSRMTG